MISIYLCPKYLGVYIYCWMLWCCHYCLWKMVLIWAREAIFAQMLTRATLVVEEPENTDKTGLQEIRHAWTEKIILIWQLITWQKLNAKIGDLQHHRNQWACISATATVIIETIRRRIHAVRASSGNGSCEQSEVFFSFCLGGGHFVAFCYHTSEWSRLSKLSKHLPL